jgi:hypothetical protein
MNTGKLEQTMAALNDCAAVVEQIELRELATLKADKPLTVKPILAPTLRTNDMQPWIDLAKAASEFQTAAKRFRRSMR